MKIPELANLETFEKFLSKKNLRCVLPSNAFDGGNAIIKPDKNNLYYTLCSISKHPNCCGSKWLHSAQGADEHIPYAIGAALLWCKIRKNASATYVVADHQKVIENSLKAFGFKCVQDVFNPKSIRKGNFRLYVINPLEL